MGIEFLRKPLFGILLPSVKKVNSLPVVILVCVCMGSKHNAATPSKLRGEVGMCGNQRKERETRSKKSQNNAYEYA